MTIAGAYIYVCAGMTIALGGAVFMYGTGFTEGVVVPLGAVALMGAGGALAAIGFWMLLNLRRSSPEVNARPQRPEDEAE